MIAPAGPRAADPAEHLAGVHGLAAAHLGRLDHVHVDVGAVALAVVEVDVVALPAVAPGLGDHRVGHGDLRRAGRGEHVLTGVDVAGARCAEGVLGGSEIDRPNDRQERAGGLATLVAVRARRPVGDPLERAPGLVVDRDVSGGGLSGLGGGRRSGDHKGRGENGADGAGSVFRSAAAHVRFPLRSQRARRWRGRLPRSTGNRSRGRDGTALGAWVSAPAPAFSRSISGRSSGSTP